MEARLGADPEARGAPNEVGRQKEQQANTSPMEPSQAHACNPSYLGGRDQKNRGSMPALGK
jgi:hypothetical protein